MLWRILVAYDSKPFGTIKGIYFKRLVMDPDWKLSRLAVMGLDHN